MTPAELIKLSLQALDDMMMDDSLMPIHIAQLRVIRSNLSRIDTRSANAMSQSKTSE